MSVGTVEAVEVAGVRLVAGVTPEAVESVRRWVETTRSWGFELAAPGASAGAGVADPMLVGLYGVAAGSYGQYEPGVYRAVTETCGRCGRSILPGVTRVRGDRVETTMPGGGRGWTSNYVCVPCATPDEYRITCGVPADDAAWRRNTAPGKTPYRRDFIGALAHEGFTWTTPDGATVDAASVDRIVEAARVPKAQRDTVRTFLVTGVRPSAPVKRGKAASGERKPRTVPAPVAVEPVAVEPVEPTPVAAPVEPTPTPAPTVEPTPVPAGADSTPGHPLPMWADEWLAGLVYAPKRDYAAGYLRAVLYGAPMPADPGAEWAGKARKRADRLVRLNG